MRAVRARDGRVELAELSAPAGPGVRVRVRSAGICGSDLHLLAVGFPPTRTLGHELAGVTADGVPVAIEPIVPCGACAPCGEGEYQRCGRGPAMILGVGQDGGMADELVVPERCLVRLPFGLDPRDACLVEPLAVAVHGLRRAGLRGGMRLAVVGGGALGLCVVAAARAAGAAVDLVARHPAQRAAGERLGAGSLDPDASARYELVVDAAGTAGALAQAVTLAEPGGRLCLVATYWEGLALPGFPLCLKEIDVVPASLYGCAAGVRDIDAAAALLAARPEIARALVTHRFPLEAAPEAFRVAGERAAGAIKVVLEP